MATVSGWTSTTSWRASPVTVISQAMRVGKAMGSEEPGLFTPKTIKITAWGGQTSMKSYLTK